MLVSLVIFSGIAILAGAISESIKRLLITRLSNVAYIHIKYSDEVYYKKIFHVILYFHKRTKFKTINNPLLKSDFIDITITKENLVELKEGLSKKPIKRNG